jgi:hypothetical protein
MKFITSEYRKHIKHAEKVQGEVSERVRNKKALEHLGAYAPKMQELVEGIYVPNIKHGLISAPMSYQNTDSTPIIGIEPGEVLFADSSLAPMCPLQFKKLLEVLEEKGVDPDLAYGINDKLKALGSRIVAIQDKDGGASHWEINSRINLQEDNFKMIGRHAVVLAMKGYDLTNSGIILVHELEHVAQSQLNPTIPVLEPRYSERVVADEMEAYMVSSRYGDALGELTLSENPVYRAHKRAERLRRESAAPEQPFTPLKPADKIMWMKIAGLNIE